jgi:4-hydroxy-tetrahydrodipicolinate reductase
VPDKQRTEVPVIKVGVLGAKGRMGSLVSETIRAAMDTELVAEVDVGDAMDGLIRCAVAVDFTNPSAVLGNIGWCVRRGIDMVIGTSGFDETRLDEASEIVRSATDERIASGASRPTVLVVPNFSIGAVLMMKFAEQAARFFESAEIIELHHAGKIDAPSGTAARTAAIISAARSQAGLGPVPDATTTAAPGARGTVMADIHVHSVRLPGLVAHQEVLLGGHGETLTIRHDSLDRASFMPGVLAAVRGISQLPAGLTVGLESLLGL